MISPEIRLFFENVCCGNYLKDMAKSCEINIKDDGKPVKSPIRIGKLISPSPSSSATTHSYDQPSGGSILFCGKRQSYFPFQCFVGPDWPMLILVYTLIIVVNTIGLSIISYLGWPVLMIGLITTCLLLYFYSAVACSDPGIIFIEDSDDDNNSNDEEMQPMVHSNSRAESPSSNKQNSSLTDHHHKISISDVENQTNNEFEHKENDNFNTNERNYSNGNNNEISSDMYNEGEIIDSSLVHAYSSSAILASNVTTINTSASTSSTSVVRSRSPNTRRLKSPSKQIKNGIECGTCEMQRPYTARHCHYCGVCVDELDHHCPCKSNVCIHMSMYEFFWIVMYVCMFVNVSLWCKLFCMGCVIYLLKRNSLN